MGIPVNHFSGAFAVSSRVYPPETQHEYPKRTRYFQKGDKISKAHHGRGVFMSVLRCFFFFAIS